MACQQWVNRDGSARLPRDPLYPSKPPCWWQALRQRWARSRYAAHLVRPQRLSRTCKLPGRLGRTVAHLNSETLLPKAASSKRQSYGRLTIVDTETTFRPPSGSRTPRRDAGNDYAIFPDGPGYPAPRHDPPGRSQVRGSSSFSRAASRRQSRKRLRPFRALKSAVAAITK
jgi:hypothetical protein